MSYLDRIEACNRYDLSRSRPFRVAGRDVGWVRDDLAEALTDFPDVFEVTADRVAVASHLTTPEARTAAAAPVIRALQEKGVILHRRDEDYPVTTAFAAPPLMRMDRGAAPRFGFRAYGIHVNGFVRDGGGLRLWVGRRALDRPVAPGKLDQMVAGGQPAGLGLEENLIKEGAEEAGLPAAVMRRAVPVGAITYKVDHPEGLRNDVLFVYDLELAPDEKPRNTDGEITGFQLLPAEEVAALVRDGEAFKFNCALVNIDFLIRHGVIAPDEPDYVALVQGLRQ
jgi:8-oxo-dGTP pyrophosphatase MutT (NUDIX family)